MTNKIVIHPDGLCIGRPGPGGWAATLQLWNEGEVLAEKIVFGHHPTKTKNEMELIATIQGLSALKPLGQNVEIATDNRAIINALNDHHARKNKELIQCLQRLAAKHDTTVRTSADQQINSMKLRRKKPRNSQKCLK